MLAEQQPCPYALGTEDRDLQPLVSVGHGQPLGQCHRSMLTHRVGERTDLGQHARSRSGMQQIALSSSGHLRYQYPRGIELGPIVHVENPLQIGIGHLGTAWMR